MSEANQLVAILNTSRMTAKRGLNSKNQQSRIKTQKAGHYD
jgi:hypothetical protein